MNVSKCMVKKHILFSVVRCQTLDNAVVAPALLLSSFLLQIQYAGFSARSPFLTLTFRSSSPIFLSCSVIWSRHCAGRLYLSRSDGRTCVHKEKRQPQPSVNQQRRVQAAQNQSKNYNITRDKHKDGSKKQDTFSLTRDEIVNVKFYDTAPPAI